MSFNGSGVFNRIYSWTNDAAAGIKIRADRMDNEDNGFAAGLSQCITKDGQTTVTANLPMATFRHTGVGSAQARTDYASFGQVQDGKAAWVDSGGTADAITAAYTIPITTLVDGQLCYVRAGFANATTMPTFSPNALTARTIVKNGGSALIPGDIAGDGHELILRYDLANTRWELLNPKQPTVPNIPYVAASASGPASLEFAEDTDNGTNKVTLTSPAALASDAVVTLPSVAGTLATLDDASAVSMQTATVTAAADAMTVQINPTSISYRSGTLTSGIPEIVRNTAAISLVIPSGATLGTINGVQSRIVVLAINNAGTSEVAVVNISGGVSLNEEGVISTTTIGTGSDSANVVYSTTARTNVAYKVIAIFDSTQATAGTWASSPTLVQSVGGNALTAMSSLGYGQTWQVVTRTSGTTYYNTTGRPIEHITQVSAASSGTLVVDGITVFTLSSPASALSSCSAIIPPGSSYVWTTASGSISAQRELR